MRMVLGRELLPQWRIYGASAVLVSFQLSKGTFSERITSCDRVCSVARKGNHEICKRVVGVCVAGGGIGKSSGSERWRGAGEGHARALREVVVFNGDVRPEKHHLQSRRHDESGNVVRSGTVAGEVAH